MIWDPVPRCPLCLAQSRADRTPACHSRSNGAGRWVSPSGGWQCSSSSPTVESDHLKERLPPGPASRKVAQGSLAVWTRAIRCVDHGGDMAWAVEGHSFRVQPPPPPTLPQIARQICHLCWTLSRSPGLPILRVACRPWDPTRLLWPAREALRRRGDSRLRSRMAPKEGHDYKVSGRATRRFEGIL